MSVDREREHDREAKRPPLCRMLRTKTAFGGGRDALWDAAPSTTAAWWCLATMEPFGPDAGYCHPTRCGERRRCYRAPDDE